MNTSSTVKSYNRKLLMLIILSGAFVALLAETFLHNGLPAIMKSFQIN